MLLERLFENLALNVEPFAVCEVSTGWRLRLDPLDHATLHFVLRGEGTLRVGGGAPRALGPFTLALVPTGKGHELRGREPTTRVSDVDGGARADGLRELVAGPGGDRELVVACGRIQARYAGALRPFALMDDPIVMDFSDSDQMRHTFGRLLEESAHPHAGSAAMMTALANECLVLVFRRLAREGDVGLPWLEALEDPRMATVLEAIVLRPEADHSLESLAERARMSRSAFAEEFAERFGRTPMAFVRDVRMRRAAELLRGTTLSVSAVARRVGYASRSQFSRAFVERFGDPPAIFRAGISPVR